MVVQVSLRYIFSCQRGKNRHKCPVFNLVSHPAAHVRLVNYSLRFEITILNNHFLIEDLEGINLTCSHWSSKIKKNVSKMKIIFGEM